MLRAKKARCLRRNGRLLRDKHVAVPLGSFHLSPRLFTGKDLEEATGGYDPRRLIKRDGAYELYAAAIGSQEVAVKRACPDLEGISWAGIGQVVEGLVTEIVVLSGVGHRNVVKLLGCCLETQVPVLVYDLHTHGTLQDHAVASAGSSVVPNLPWPARLRMAAEVAAGLQYLHYHAPLTLVHRDLKPSSILVDEHGVPKIADFSLSLTIPPDRRGARTDAAAGSIYYRDPEIYSTGAATEKSDVYSFGALLISLMVGKHLHEWEEESGYPLLSALGYGEEEIAGLVPREELAARAAALGEAGGRAEQLWALADLAFECLRKKGEERPTMRDVERRLREISTLMP